MHTTCILLGLLHTVLKVYNYQSLVVNMAVYSGITYKMPHSVTIHYISASQTFQIHPADNISYLYQVKVKVADTRLPSVGFQSWSWFLAVGLQVTSVINPAVGCLYFLQACSYPHNPLEGCYKFCCLVNTGCGTVCLRLLPDSVMAAIWNQALLWLSPAR